MRPVWRELRAWFAYQQGLMLRFMGHRTLRREAYERAVAAFGQALRLRPDHIEARLARGLLYWRELHQLQAAIADFTMVIETAPDRVEALFFRGMAYQGTGDYRAAVDDLAEAVARGQGQPWHMAAYRQYAALEPLLDELADRLPSPSSPGELPGASIED